jgi:hypothetical protein
MYLLAICASSFEDCLINSFAYLLIGMFVILVFNFEAPFIFWILIFYSMTTNE